MVEMAITDRIRNIIFIIISLIVISMIVGSCASIAEITGEPSLNTSEVTVVDVNTVIADATLSATDPINVPVLSFSYFGVTQPFTIINNYWDWLTISDVLVKNGSIVEKGDVLAEIKVPADFKEQFIEDSYRGSYSSLILTRTKSEYLESHKETFENNAKFAMQYFEKKVTETTDYYTSITIPRATKEELIQMQNEMTSLDWDMRRLAQSEGNNLNCYSSGRYDQNPFEITYYDNYCYFYINRTGDAKKFSAIYDQKTALEKRYGYLSATYTDEQIYQAKVNKFSAKEQYDQAKVIYDQIIAGDYTYTFSPTHYWDGNNELTGWWFSKNEELTAYNEMEELENFFTIRAPFDGVVLSVNLESGQEIPSYGVNNAFQMVDPTDMRLMVNVPQKFANLLDLSTDVHIYSQTGAEILSGTPLALNPVAKHETSPLLVPQNEAIDLDSNPEIYFELLVQFDPKTSSPLIGSTYQVELPLTSPIAALSVPLRAVRRNGEYKYVLVKGMDAEYEVEVTVIKELVGDVVIVAPRFADALIAGDTVILQVQK